MIPVRLALTGGGGVGTCSPCAVAERPVERTWTIPHSRSPFSGAWRAPAAAAAASSRLLRDYGYEPRRASGGPGRCNNSTHSAQTESTDANSLQASRALYRIEKGTTASAATGRADCARPVERDPVDARLHHLQGKAKLVKSTEMLELLREFYRDKVALRQRHLSSAQVVSDYNFNNSYQYVIAREDMHVRWLADAVTDLSARNEDVAAATR